MDGKLQGPLLVTLLSIALVFAVLVILMLIFKLQSKTSRNSRLDNQSKDEDSAAATLDDSNNGSKNIGSLRETNLEEDEELVAVIAAAISAYTGLSMQQFRVKSVKLIDNDSNWRRQSLL